MNKQQMEGHADIQKGNLKKAAGEKLSGVADKVKGNLKKAVGDIKEKIYEAKRSSQTTHSPRHH